VKTMKKTSNKILVTLFIGVTILGIALLIFIKINGKGLSMNTTELTVNDELVHVKISYSVQKDDLVNIQKQLLEEKNISFDFSESTFNEKGEIEKLKINVDCNDGFTGWLSASEFELKLSYYGFMRDYTEKAEEPFTIGEIKLTKEFLIE